ncbi:PAS-domain containing protein [Fretibacter rubidus]|uniref:PAS domain-containing hybrid sensor histidine kinase/response regulator n=1 Tax=Fretibacter rubidus TaxID=570162 RepID=UPI00352A5D6C
MPLWLIIIVTTAYVLGLFFIAWTGDKAAKNNEALGRYSGIGYALALAVYCTSWTYFGAVGTAASAGWDYIWIYAGPALVFLCFPHVIRRIGDIAQRESITSLSDFLSARYGKSRGVAILATCAAVMGSLPYIALQLKSVGLSLSAMTGQSGLSNESVLLTAIAMAVFAILFGARHSDVTQHNRGLMRVLGFEAIVKLLALMMVCALSIAVMDGGPTTLMSRAEIHFDGYSISGRAITIMFLSMAAIICLPRQFHVAIIERRDSQEVSWARWIFPLYLLLTSLVVVPITMAGLSVLSPDVSPDLYVIQLPLSQGDGLLAMFVFLGGFSAATGMVIVATIALSTMVTNDIIVPYFIERDTLTKGSGDGGAKLILIRRGVIVALLMLAYCYYRLADDSAALANIGLLSFAAAAQFAPALLGSIYWRHGKKNGVIVGLAAGMCLWAFTMFFPAVFGIDAVASILPEILNPHGLFGINFGDSLTHGVFWSLGINIVSFVLVSWVSTERLRDRVQAVAFTAAGTEKIASGVNPNTEITSVSPDGLAVLAARFLEAEAVSHSFEKFGKDSGAKVSGTGPADWQLVQHTEKLLARAIGASSARVIMSSVLAGVNVELDDLLTIFDQKSYADRFDQHMLQSTLENVSQGISVVDGDQKLVAWNGAYIELFNYPPQLVHVGAPIQNLIEHNISTGWIEGDNTPHQARRRVNHMRAGKPHIYERQNPDGRFIRITGSPMPGGGYVTTFTDITEDKRREKALIEANETLEARVAKRTEELQALTQDLDKAREEAVGANASKTRFLAAASHDLLQPLNAARLFLGAVDGAPENAALLKKADQSIQSADELLKGLLDISRLDHSNVKAQTTDIALGPLFEDLVDEAAPMAAKAGLDLRFVPTRLSVKADPDFLQSIVRNYLSNARRYTKEGGIVLGARRRDGRVVIEVWDSGPGIAPDKLDQIFEEFQRFEDVDNLGIRGAGLGLSVAQRMAELMGTALDVKSTFGKGSVFSVAFERAKTQPVRLNVNPVQPPPQGHELAGLTVLCVDDELTILDAMTALLSRWNCTVLTCTNGDDAIELARHNDVGAIIADFQLGQEENGLHVIAQLRPYLARPENVCLLSALKTKDIERYAANDNIRILSKPANPEDIRQFLLTCLPKIAAE